MKALVYHGPGQKSLDERPKPDLQAPTDAIVRVTKTTICGTDLHILKGDVTTCEPGRILGHEGVGIVEKVGTAVGSFKAGDHVLISCITSCARCEYCRRGMYSHCADGGWILGNTIDGTQAEFVRIPHADNSLHPIPAGADEEALVMLSDILPTGYECGVLNGKVAPGSSVAIVNLVRDLTEGKGVDAAIEAVGVPATFGLCEELVAPGGVIANVGVHGTKVDLHLEQLWSRNVTITTRLVDTVSTPMLLKTVEAKRLQPEQLVTHRFALDDILGAYETFSNAAVSQALKVVIAT
ncbi:MAG: alcohol dehydrogenase [Sphingobium sp. 32-64-5]|nr:MAG: alcohol dehydrogenase [Sphingobium sp. 32-64-5]